MKEKTRAWLESDYRHCWHPFTDQGEWAEGEQVIIERGEGVWLYDSEGKKYFDGNSSIWTNLHGHAHPLINEALREQAEKIAHSSYLGFANPRASELAQKLCGFFPEGTLERCFFSDDGSTALEVALKMAVQFLQQNGEQERTKVVSFDRAYHGDTLGAASVGGVTRFLGKVRGYDALIVKGVDDLQALAASEIAAIVIEPMVQGVNEMNLWPVGMLGELRSWCDEAGAKLIYDEVMTGFGRTGQMFACQHEEIWPDFLCLAKGLSGGYLPLAATLTTEAIYEGFIGAGRTFYYGHSFTGNQLGCAAALASLRIFEEEKVLEGLVEKMKIFQTGLDEIKKTCDGVRDVRLVGLIAGVELVSEGEKGKAGKRACASLREQGVLTRPILDTVVLMPPLATSERELEWLLEKVRVVLADRD